MKFGDDPLFSHTKLRLSKFQVVSFCFMEKYKIILFSFFVTFLLNFFYSKYFHNSLSNTIYGDYNIMKVCLIHVRGK